MKRIIYISSLVSIMMSSCFDMETEERADGYGNFEATEVTVSAQVNGELNGFSLNEGDVISKEILVGYVDTTQLLLKKEQLLSQVSVIRAQSKGVLSQITVIEEQIKAIEIDKKRVENLLKDEAATPKQLDDLVSQINIRKEQIRSIEAQNTPIVSQFKNIDIQVKQVEDKIQKSKIINPVDGTVLVKYVENKEIVNFGKPLYKIADLNDMILRVYIGERQLAGVQIGQKVSISIDDGEGSKSYEGKISWISSTAEFTPKIIQTKEERVNLVYAMKIAVKNDGSLKIGMPGEAMF